MKKRLTNFGVSVFALVMFVTAMPINPMTAQAEETLKTETGECTVSGGEIQTEEIVELKTEEMGAEEIQEEELPHMFEVSPRDFTYSVNYGDVAVTITGYKGSETILEIPSEIDGYIVEKIGRYAFSENDTLEKVVIPNTVTELEQGAFEKCTALQTVVLSEGLRIIGNYAFKSCSMLESITIPDTVNTIGIHAFMYCSGMKTIELPKSLKEIKERTFEGCSALESIIIPDAVTYMGESAFYDCKALRSVKLSQKLTKIQNGTFEGCKALESITIPNSVTGIGEYAFLGCEALETLNLPKGLEKLGHKAFQECKSLKSIVIPEGVTTIGRYTFKDCSSLEEIKLSSATKEIGSEAFRNCIALKSIEIPDNARFYYDHSYANNPNYTTSYFEGCSSLTTVKLPANLKEIPPQMFKDCISLEKIDIPDNVTEIGTSAFEGCTMLKEIELPKKVQYIYVYAFMKCSELKTIVIFDSVRGMGDDIFSYSPQVTIHGVEGSCVESYASDYGIPFQKLVYKIAFNKNSSAATGTMSQQSADYGYTLKLNNNKFKRADYNFVGWNTKQEGSGTNYTDGEIVKNLASHKDETVTLYAQWKIITYDIIYNLDGGTNKSSNPSTYTHATKTFKLKNPTKTGYTFGGWYSDKKMTKKVTQIDKGTRGDKMLYAKWIPNKYTIKFNGNRATSGKMSNMKNRKYGTSYKLSANKFKRTGYTFKGWTTKKNGQGNYYGNKSKVMNLTATNGKIINLYAQWTPVTYKIKYQLRGGYNSYSNPTSYNITSKTFTLKAPSRYGYTFKGWYRDSKCTQKVTKIKKGSTGNITLYAKWQKR